jgi:hypothetical protein
MSAPRLVGNVMARYALDEEFRFAHHTFAVTESSGEMSVISPEHAVPLLDPQTEHFRQVAGLLREAGVRNILLIHGTFAGGDVTGLVRELKRFSPVRASRVHELSKAWFDELAGDIGNYTDGFSKRMHELLNVPGEPEINIDRFGWSGENHHIGRADGAVALLRKIDSMNQNGRLLILAHSHGGNLLAMLSQIVGASDHVRESFFRATRLHYHSLLRSKVDLQDWTHAREMLLDRDRRPRKIDIATFGMPLRYRWNRDVVPRLLHFTQHRSIDGHDPMKAVIPRSVSDVVTAASGDYVQHLGIAGTDFIPSLFAWRDLVVERRLHWLFESTTRRRDVFQKLKQGRRASCDGKTLLLDYPATPGREHQKLFGHGVYTSPIWLRFHLETICEHFYSQVSSIGSTGERELGTQGDR